MNKFERELVTLINRHCMENDSDTPDYMLAEYIVKCLEAFNQTVKRRERWYGRGTKPLTFTDPADNPEPCPHTAESTQAPGESESLGASCKDAGTEVSK